MTKYSKKINKKITKSKKNKYNKKTCKKTSTNKKYNKGIKKSRSGQYGGNNNTPRKEPKKITLDGITFELLEFREDFASNRGLLKIKSTNSGGESFIFFVYRSLSELGFWRFGYNLISSSDPVSLWKGVDYIQTTFIDLRLQEFINRSLNDIPKSTKINCTLNKYIRLNDFYQKDSSGEYVYNNNNNNAKPSKIPDDKKIIGNDGIIVSIDNRGSTAINKKFHDSDYKYTYGICSTGPSKNQINDAANLLRHNYNIDKESKYEIYKHYKFKVNLVKDEELYLKNSVIHSVILKKKPSTTPSPTPSTTPPSILELLPSNLKLYYIHIIELNIKSTEFGDKLYTDYKIPVFLEILDDEVSNQKILNTGLYPEFLTLGAYICKTLEYSRQCHFRDTTKCTSKYSFTGDLYMTGNDGGPVFPFDEI